MKKLSLKNDVNLSKNDLFGIYDWGILFVVFPDFINEYSFSRSKLFVLYVSILSISFNSE